MLRYDRDIQIIDKCWQMAIYKCVLFLEMRTKNDGGEENRMFRASHPQGVSCPRHQS